MHSKFKKVRKVIDVVIGAGDAIFIPAHWMHVAHGNQWSVSTVSFYNSKINEWKWNFVTIHSLLMFPIYKIMKAKRLLVQLFRLKKLKKEVNFE